MADAERTAALATPDSDLVATLCRACELGAQPESEEEEPYKHKYEAADLLRKALGEKPLLEAPAATTRPEGTDAPLPDLASAAGTSATPIADAAQAAPTTETPEKAGTAGPAAASEAPLSESALLRAAARLRSGLLLLETDMLHEGEPAVKAGIAALESRPEWHTPWLLEGYNALGALYRWAHVRASRAGFRLRLCCY
jgi:hypothetical protein